MNEGRPYLQMRRGVWVPFCKIAIVTLLSVRYKSDGLYCRMTGTPSSPTPLYCVKKTLFFIIIHVIYIPLDFSYVYSCDIKDLYISLQREYLFVKIYIYV